MVRGSGLWGFPGVLLRVSGFGGLRVLGVQGLGFKVQCLGA